MELDMFIGILQLSSCQDSRENTFMEAEALIMLSRVRQ